MTICVSKKTATLEVKSHNDAIQQEMLMSGVSQLAHQRIISALVVKDGNYTGRPVLIGVLHK